MICERHLSDAEVILRVNNKLGLDEGYRVVRILIYS